MNEPQRLFSLDAARAIAALAVVFQHWEHFFRLDRFVAPLSQAPLFWMFEPLYEKGARAVGFFFCLSGFIFYWLYANRIHQREVGPASFAVLRLSRLYPLHLATLLVVVALQWPMIASLGAPFIYPEHDLPHFVMNVLLVQYWGFESGFSFNGPSWSISVEIFLYLAFFIVCFLHRPSIFQCLALVLVSVALARFSQLAVAATPFFVGGAAYFVFRELAPRWSATKNLVLVAVAILAWIILPAFAGSDEAPGAPAGLLERLLSELADRQFEFVLFPLTVLAVALSETAWKGIPWRRMHDLGNMSFGIYLLHFPLQLAFALAAIQFRFAPDFFTRTSTLALFFALLLLIAAASYRWFERPTMNGIRHVWRNARPAKREAPTTAPS